MLACKQAILPAIDEKQHGGSHYAEKPQLLRSAFCILPGCRNRSTISGNARWDRRKYRTETSTRKTSAALLHPRIISDPEKIYRGLRSQHTLLRVPNKIESTDLDATRQCYRAMRKTEVAADLRPLRLCSYVFALLQSRCRPIQNLLRKGDCLLCMMFLDGQLIRIPCHGTERRQGIRRIADCIRDGDIVVDLIQ